MFYVYKLKCNPFLLFLLLCCVSINAQTFRNFPSFTGKKNVAATCVLQSPDGGLWIGSEAGLAFYDGENFKLFTKTDGLSDNSVSAIFVQNDNTLWIGHKNGKITLFKNKKFIPFEFNEKLSGEPVSGFTEADGIWIASYGSGLALYTNDHKFIQFNTTNGLSDDFVYTLCHDSKGNVIAGTDAGMTLITSKNNSHKFSVISMKEGLPDNIVRDLVCDKNDNLWIAMQDSGVCNYDISSGRFKRISSSNGWKYGTVTSLCQSLGGAMNIGTKENGVIKYSVSKDGKGSLTVIDSKSGLLTNQVNAVFCDREDNLWTCTEKGISEVYQGRISYLNSKNGLPSDKVLSIYIGSEGNNWISTDAGLTKYSVHQDGDAEFKNYFPTGGVAEKQITCIHEDKFGILWLGTNGSGLYRFDPLTEKNVNISQKQGLANDNISSVFSDMNGNLWVATLGGGISEIVLSKDKWEIKNYSSNESLSGDYFYTAFPDSKNNIWLGTDGSGLAQFKDGSFSSITERKKLKGQTVFSVTEDLSGKLWFSTSEDGIYKHDLSADAFTNYSTLNGLRDNSPAILISSGEKIIVVHTKGIDMLDQHSDKLSYFSLSDSDIEPNLNAGFADKEKNVWIGTNSGIIKFRSSDEITDTITPLVRLNSLVVQYQPFPLDSTNLFSYTQNNFIFNFSATWFRPGAKVKFRYKLEGVDKDYFETENKSVSYSSLAPGEYTFLLSAANNEGRWTQPFTYHFIIETPLWQHWWFWLIVLVVLFGGVYFFIQYRLRILQKEKHVLEEKVQERTAEVVAQKKSIEAKNKDITDSIEYAKRIQNSILPAMKSIKESIPDSFVLFLQKDIVSGDFYWFTQRDDIAIIAAVDCTGHGVPGAFMSLIGYNLLNQIINENHVLEPGEILNELNKGIIKALYQNNPTSKDGMDIAICSINFKKNEVHFAGAMRPLYIFKGNDFEEIKGDKMSIGTQEGERDHEIKFTTNVIKASKGDVFYISSDGYADQFGGETGKKMMTKNFKNILKEVKDKPFKEQYELVFNYHQMWKGRHEQVDDILVIGFSF